MQSIWAPQRGDIGGRGRNPAGLVALDQRDADVVLGGGLLQRAGGDIGVVVLRRENGDRFLAPARGEFDDPVDVILDQEGQQVDAARGGGQVGRIGDHRLARGLGDFGRRAHVAGEEWAEDQLRALADRRLRASRAPSGVERSSLTSDRDVIGAGFRESPAPPHCA